MVVNVFGSHKSKTFDDSIRPIHFTIAVKQQNTEYLRELLSEISNPQHPNYGKWLTIGQINNFVVDPYANQKIAKWVDSVDLECRNYGDSFECIADVYKLTNLFNVTMHFTTNGHPQSYEESYTTPVEINDFIRFIDGLSNPINLRHSRNRGNHNSALAPIKPIEKKIKETQINEIDPGLFAREVAIRVYNITYDTVQHGSTGGVIEFQEGGYSSEGLGIFQQCNDLQINEPSINVGHNNGGDPETILDLDMLSTVAANLTLGYYNYPIWLYSAFANLNTRKNVPKVISISYGWAIDEQCQIAHCNQSQNQQYVYSVDTELVKLGLQGISVIVASGDTGALSRSNEVCEVGPDNVILHATYPGVSPYVTSVGGTALEKGDQQFEPKTTLCKEFGCANGTIQRSINFMQEGWTTGGGFNIYSNRTNDSQWQNAVVTEYLTSGIKLPNNPNLWNPNGRASPDVTGVANNCSTYGVVWSEGILPLSGTSCSSPVFASLIVLLNDKFNRSLGFINPLIYQAQKQGVFDFVHGSNISCTEYLCCPNHNYGYSMNDTHPTIWNPVTGLGSLNFGRFVEYLTNYLGF